jgi:hypothetical protein
VNSPVASIANDLKPLIDELAKSPEALSTATLACGVMYVELMLRWTMEKMKEETEAKNAREAEQQREQK